MLDQPVPNPVAKNPNIYTHKVFAAVGLILIGVIILIAGVWWYVERQGGFKADEDNDSSTKIATNAANLKDTTNWKTYDYVGQFKYPDNLTALEDFGEGIFYTADFVSEKNQVTAESPCKGVERCYLLNYTTYSYHDGQEGDPYYVKPEDRDPGYSEIDNIEIGSSSVITDDEVPSLTAQEKVTRKENYTSGGYSWLMYEVEVLDNNNSLKHTVGAFLKKTNNLFYIIRFSSDSKENLEDKEEVLKKIIQTYKFPSS